LVYDATPARISHAPKQIRRRPSTTSSQASRPSEPAHCLDLPHHPGAQRQVTLAFRLLRGCWFASWITYVRGPPFQVALHLPQLLGVGRPEPLPLPDALFRLVRAVHLAELARQAEVPFAELFAVGGGAGLPGEDLALHGHGLAQRRQGFL